MAQVFIYFIICKIYCAADIRLALVWYGKARDFGSPEAPRRLELLASRDH